MDTHTRIDRDVCRRAGLMALALTLISASFATAASIDVAAGGHLQSPLTSAQRATIVP